MAKAKTTSITIRQPKKKSRRRRGGTTIPLAIVAGFAPLASWILSGWKAGGLQGALKEGTLALTGVYTADGKFYPQYLSRGAYPILIGMAVHFLAKRFGVNRVLARAGVPLIRV